MGTVGFQRSWNKSEVLVIITMYRYGKHLNMLWVLIMLFIMVAEGMPSTPSPSTNTADALTKPLPKPKFLEHRSLLVRESAAWGGVRVDAKSDGRRRGEVGVSSSGGEKEERV